MAELVTVIDSVRRQVGDYKEPRKYADDYYKDAIEFSLGKLSFDFGEDYSSVPTVVSKHVFLLVKLAAIQMCNVRMADALEGDADGEDSSGSSDGITSVAVPDLSVSMDDPSSSDEVAGKWLELAKALQEEYDGELKTSGGASNTAEIQTGFLNAHSYRHGGLANRRLDKGIPATVLAATVSGNDVRLSWDVVYHPEFLAYEIWRSTDNFVTRSRVLYRGDNQKVTCVDEGLEVGTYQYQAFTVNPNSIKTPSNILEVVVS